MRRGWFDIPDVQRGDRTIAQQLNGLAPALARAADKTVFDVGSAEGLIGMEFARAGARSVFGIDITKESIEVAKRLVVERNLEKRCRFQAISIDELIAQERASSEVWHYDIVLMLAVLHKLPDPRPALNLASDCAGELIVIRLPASTGSLIAYKHDPSRRVDAVPFLLERGWSLGEVTAGHEGEWCGYFER